MVFTEIDKFISSCESDTSSAMLLIDIADFDKLNQQFGYLYGNKI